MPPLRPDLDPLPLPPAEPERPAWRGTLGVVLGLAAGALLGMVLDEMIGAGDAPGPESEPGAPWWIVVPVTVVAVLGVLAAHEIGHLVGGRLVGFRFVLLVVGPLHVERTGERLRWRLNRSLAMAGGLAFSTPTDTHDLRRRTAVMIAGGPVASVLLGVLALAATRVAPGEWGDLALLIGVASMGIALVTVWPGRTGGFLTDGARMLRLVRGGPMADREAAILAVLTQSISGVRPRDWDAGTVAALDIDTGADPMAESALAFLTSRAFDTGDAPAARAALARRVEDWDEGPSVTRGGLAADAALFEAGVRGDAERARAWLERVPARGITDPSQVETARAAMHAAEGDLTSAQVSADAARAALVGALDAGGAVARQDWLSAYAGASPAGEVA